MRALRYSGRPRRHDRDARRVRREGPPRGPARARGRPAEVDDEFLRKGVQLVVDGTDPELVKEILQTEVDSLAEENERNARRLDHRAATARRSASSAPSWASCSCWEPQPTPQLARAGDRRGVHRDLLRRLLRQPRLPADRHEAGRLLDDEIAGRELMIEGILAIQSGDNPRIVEEKLVAFLDATDASAASWPSASRRRRIRPGGVAGMSRRAANKAGEAATRLAAEERWLLTYADMITLLLALFIVLFAMSTIDQLRFASVARELSDDFSWSGLPTRAGTSPAGRPACLTHKTIFRSSRKPKRFKRKTSSRTPRICRRWKHR